MKTGKIYGFSVGHGDAGENYDVGDDHDGNNDDDNNDDDNGDDDDGDDDDNDDGDGADGDDYDNTFSIKDDTNTEEEED